MHQKKEEVYGIGASKFFKNKGKFSQKQLKYKNYVKKVYKIN